MSLQVWLPLQGDLHNQGLSNTIIANNNSLPTTDNSGKLGKCQDFTNGNILSLINNLPTNMSTISMTCWINASAWNKTYLSPCYIPGISSGTWQNSCGFSTFGSTTNQPTDMYFVVSNGTTSQSVSVSLNQLPINTWIHLAGTYDGTNVKIYINGNLAKTKAVSSGFSMIIPQGNININHFSGQVFKMNDVRIYDHALSPKEVEEIAKGLVLWYQLNDDTVGGITNLLTKERSIPTGDWITYTSQNSNAVADRTVLSYKIINGENVVEANAIKNTNRKVAPYQRYSGFEEGKTYTFSCYVKAKTAADVGQTVRTTSWNNDNQFTHATIYNPYSLTLSWQRVAVTITFKATNPDPTTTPNAYIGLDIPGVSASHVGEEVNYYCTRFMLEEGDRPSSIWIEGGTTIQNNTIYDSSGYSHNGTIIGSLTAAAPSPRYNVATTFPTESDYFSLPHLVDSTAMNNEFTFSCWLYRDYTDATTRYFYYGLCAIYLYTDFKPRMTWRLASADLSYDSGNTSAMGPVIAAQTWTHLVFTFKNGVLYFYVNGVQYGPSDRSNNGQFIHGTQGSPNASLGYSWIGKMSDIRTYATALTADQVKELYNTSMSIDSSGNIHARELVEL